MSAALTPRPQAQGSAGLAEDDTTQPSSAIGTSTPWQESMAALEADVEAQKFIINVVGRVLDKKVRKNDALCRVGQGTCRAWPLPNFEGMQDCPLRPSAYISRMLKYSACSPCNLVIALIYLERLERAVRTDKLSTRRRDITTLRLTSRNAQRLLLTAVMLACKFFDELVVSNKQWSLIGDLKASEMHELEMDMLWTLKFSLHVTREEYDDCCKLLVELDKAQCSTLATGKPKSQGVDATVHGRQYRDS